MKNSIKRKIKNSDIVSFDMFDTLIKRNLYNPKDIFILIERIYNYKYSDKIEFATIRSDAESKAYKQLNKIPNIDDIYNAIDEFTEEKKTIFKKLELDLESKLIIVKEEGKEIYDYAKSQGKVCILTSDMYLSKAILKEILEKLGYSFDEYFISCEFNASKSNYKLYEIIKEKYKLKKIIHIGDDYKNDFVKARISHISSIKIKGRDKRKNYSLDESLVYSISNNKRFDNELKSFGYKYFGPYMLKFAKFIKDNSDNKKILFLARDGYFMKEVYETLYQSTNVYFYASRKAIVIPRYSKDSSLENVHNTLTFGRLTSFKELLHRLNVSTNLPNVDIEKKYNSVDFFTSKNINQIYEKYIRPVLDINSANQYRYLTKYFYENVDNKETVIVDIGWFGSMQNALKTLFPDVTIKGIYTGMFSNDSDKIGFMFDKKTSIKLFCKEHFFNSLFELLFSAPHGSIKEYKEVNGKIFPVMDAFNENLKNDYNNIRQIQKAALDFINDIKEYNNILGDDYKSDERMINFLADPDKDFLKEISKINFEDVDYGPIMYYHEGIDIAKKIQCCKRSCIKTYSIKMNFGINVSHLYAFLYKVKLRLKGRL